MYASSRQRFEYIHENMKNMKPWNPYLAKLIYIYGQFLIIVKQIPELIGGEDLMKRLLPGKNAIQWGRTAKFGIRALITILYYLLHTDQIRRME